MTRRSLYAKPEGRRKRPFLLDAIYSPGHNATRFVLTSPRPIVNPVRRALGLAPMPALYGFVKGNHA